MQVTLWGTRGSLAAPGPETARYGGNTACVEVRSADGAMLILDAGTGLRRLGMHLPHAPRRIDLLLTHLHMDHIQGLGFFKPLYEPGVAVHIWGPASSTLSLWKRLSRYLSPPLFPVRLRDLPCKILLHEVPCPEVTIGPFRVATALVCHPGPTVGYRISSDGASCTYLPDHEPALGAQEFPLNGAWTSGYELAAGTDLLIHDAQFTSEEYRSRIGWGHSSIPHAFAFAALAKVKHFVPFHHDPSHTDELLDQLFAEAVAREQPPFTVTPGTEGMTFELTSDE